MLSSNNQLIVQKSEFIRIYMPTNLLLHFSVHIHLCFLILTVKVEALPYTCIVHSSVETVPYSFFFQSSSARNVASVYIKV